MAAGDMLAGDYQFQLGSTLYGRGSNGVSIDNAVSIDGLGVPDAKTQDVVWNFKDGVYANPDYVQLRVITIPVLMRGTPATLMGNAKALTLAWVPVISDIDLALQLPGWSKFYVLGRPRGLKLDLKLMNRGAARGLLRFDCPDPTITFI